VPAFCNEYLATPTVTVPSAFATCGSSRISSACSCLTTTTAPCTPTHGAPNPTASAYGPCVGSEAYCVDGSAGSNIILRCNEGATPNTLNPGNCNDNLDEPPNGALCLESSPTAGDAVCWAIGSQCPVFPVTTVTTPTVTPTPVCNRDNCFRAIIAYSTTVPSFCNEYIATPTVAVPSAFATCGSSRISSACSCLTTPPSTTTSCPPVASASGCPSTPEYCCQWFCGAALVPFDFCSPTNDISPFSACCQCGTPNCGVQEI